MKATIREYNDGGTGCRYVGMGVEGLEGNPKFFGGAIGHAWSKDQDPDRVALLDALETIESAAAEIRARLGLPSKV